MKEYYVGPSYSKQNMKVSNAVWTILILSFSFKAFIYISTKVWTCIYYNAQPQSLFINI